MLRRIIYLHGFASGPSSRKAQFFRECFEREGVAVEVPALDGGNFEGLTLTGQLDVVARAARGEPVWLIGSSMGGYLAALYAARHPEVEKAVLLAPGFAFAKRWPEVIGVEAFEEWKRNGVTQVFHYGENRLARLGFQLHEDALRYEDYPVVPQPALIFHGYHDEVLPYQTSETFARSRSNVVLHILNTGHEMIDVLEPIWQSTRRFLLGRD
jgi:hypothetical protein